MTANRDRGDEALVAAYVAGDRSAFDELVTRYQRRVYAICYRYFGNSADAEDAAQDAFVTLMRRASTFRGAASFSTWMFRVATNACNDLARKRARRPKPSEVEIADLADTLTAEDVIAQRELNVELRAALDTLDSTSRTAVVLHDLQGLPYADVAAHLDLPVGTVKSRIHRAHHRLALALRPSPLPEPPDAG